MSYGTNITWFMQNPQKVQAPSALEDNYFTKLYNDIKGTVEKTADKVDKAIDKTVNISQCVAETSDFMCKYKKPITIAAVSVVGAFLISQIWINVNVIRKTL